MASPAHHECRLQLGSLLLHRHSETPLPPCIFRINGIACTFRRPAIPSIGLDASLGVGAFFENGPFRPSGNVLVRNEYSWNTEANMLFVEASAGVGFSYSRNMSDYEGMNDERTCKNRSFFILIIPIDCHCSLVPLGLGGGEGMFFEFECLEEGK